MSERVDFGGDFKAAMSLGQSPLAKSSGVGSSGWAVLQRRQDIISEGDCDGGCNYERVHKGLVFTVIVMLSSSSFLTSTILFCLLTSWWSSFRWFSCGRDTLRRVMKWAGIEGWLGERVVWSVWADLPVPVFVFLHWGRVSFIALRILMGGIRAWWR